MADFSKSAAYEYRAVRPDRTFHSEPEEPTAEGPRIVRMRMVGARDELEAHLMARGLVPLRWERDDLEFRRLAQPSDSGEAAP